MNTQLKVLFSLLLFPLVFWGQQPVRDLWGDYYFLNEEYKKAISYFESYSGEKSHTSRRHWAMAYLKTGQKEKALLTYTPIANSPDASVEDYYIYADLLVGQPKLANEYREKAFRLPWDSPSILFNESHKKTIDTLSAYNIQNIEGNTADSDFGMIFPTGPNDSLVFFLSKQQIKKNSSRVLKRYMSNYPIYDIYQAVLDVKDFRLKDKKPLRKNVNSFLQEGPGGVDPSGNRLYFTQSAKRLDKQKNVLLKLYSIGLDELEAPVLPKALDIVPVENTAMHPSVSRDGKTLYFTSDMPGGFGGMDLYRAVWKEGKFQNFENLGPDINTEADEVFPFSHRNDILFYASKANRDEGDLNVKMAHNRIDKRWESFSLAQDINTIVDDFSFGMDSNQDWAWFSSNRAGGAGEDDMYLFAFTPSVDGLPDFYQYVPSDTLVVALENVQKNDLIYAYSKDPLQRLLEREVILEIPPKNGNINLNSNGTFWYKNQSPLQLKDSFAYKVQTVKGNSKPIWVKLQREAINELPEDLKTPLLPIYYALDASDVLQQYKGRVEKVVELMKKYPDLEIELRSYTDCRGNYAYNQSLSERRTQSIVRYVQDRIDNPGRIYGKGYGEELANPYKLKDYQLIAGSFRKKDNVKQLISKLKTLGMDVKATAIGDLTRVIVAESDFYNELKIIKLQLEEQLNIPLTIQSACYQLSEEAHQENRKTTFTVIRIKK